MNTIEIIQILKSDNIVSQLFEGVFPINNITKILKYPAALVVNLDPHDKPGSHWVCMYFSSTMHCDYFDSYGLPPNKHISRYIQENSNSHTFNDKQIQQFSTSTCGQMCIYFLVWRCRGISIKSIVKNLDQPYADSFVTGFVNGLFRVSTAIYDENFIVNQIAQDYKYSATHEIQ